MASSAQPGAPSLPADALLRLWEVGAAQHPVDRALTILAATEPGLTRRELAGLPCGRRDERLLEIYEATFGRELVAQGCCPECGGRVEFTLDALAVRATGGGASSATPLTVAGDDFVVSCRLPDSYDLAAIVPLTDVAEARRLLLERCILQASQGGTEVGIDAVPEHVVDLLAGEMTARDPLAVIEVDVTCPGCGCRWQVLFDIASFLWSRIEAQARRLVKEVHALARAYGWSEADILAMGAGRRQAYLELVL